MQRQQILGGCILLAAAAAIIWGTVQTSNKPDTAEDGFAAYEELLAAAPVAEPEGEAFSPNGQFKVRTLGASDLYVSGVRVPERLQIVDARTGEVKWEDRGYMRQSVLWSPEGNLVTLAYSGRTWTEIKVLSTAYWTGWNFTLPDGEGIPEYTFLPEEWGEWLDSDSLLVTMGDGDGVERHTYRCSLRVNSDGTFSSSVLEEITESLPWEYDFDHDGRAETLELTTVVDPETPYFPAWYELRVRREDRQILWTQEAALAHVGWDSLFACTVDGQDYLLRYTPWTGQGYSTYGYQLFSLNSRGEEVVFQENQVEFDMMFGSELHQSFDPTAIAAFLEEVHGWLDESILLASTEGGLFRSGGSGADFREDMDFWNGKDSYDKSLSLEENLQALSD